jgi:hypothetical protein
MEFGSWNSLQPPIQPRSGMRWPLSLVSRKNPEKTIDRSIADALAGRQLLLVLKQLRTLDRRGRVDGGSDCYSMQAGVYAARRRGSNGSSTKLPTAPCSRCGTKPAIGAKVFSYVKRLICSLG